MSTNRNKIQSLLELEETKQLIEKNIINASYPEDRLHWYSSDLDKAKRDIKSLAEISNLQETKELIDAKIIKPEYLAERLHWYSGDFNKVKNEIIKIKNIPKNLETIKKNLAYIEGATAGALSQGDKSNKIPKDLGKYTGTFLGRIDGAHAARTSKSAASSATRIPDEKKESTKIPRKS